MRRDAFKLKRGKLSASALAESKALCARRAQKRDALNLVPRAGLPVSDSADEILSLLAAHQVVVVAGETGSGKTTQLPKLLLSLGLGVTGSIAHTQPRRLAARTVSLRIAEETGTQLGDAVGYAVRFSDTVADHTLVKVMTDGLLLTEIRSDRFLDAYDAVIIDEAHERSLNIDFLLGYLKRLTAKRRDLKVVITSATIDVERFSAFFNDAPIVTVDGRTYPVEVVYQGEPETLLDGVINALEDIETRPHKGASDVLAFCSGEREIFELARELRRYFVDRFEILPLYARLSLAEQRKVFTASRAKRRVVLATNVAETSITVPNIGFVIDPGFARINRYSYRSKLQRLPIEPIAKSSANQRQGRCGRIAPGVCFRLYDEQDYLSRADFGDPEIRRVNLASVVLQMQAFNLGEIQRFPFVDPPEPRAVKDAMRLLEELGAMVGSRLTDTGRQMAQLPMDPRLARMLHEAHKLGALRELLIITAALSVQDPRERPIQKASAADQAHERFQDDKSDFKSLLNLWGFIEDQRNKLTRNRASRALSKLFINPVRVREWREVHRQLRQVCRSLGLAENTSPASYAAIHEAVLSGSLSLIARHDEKGVYIGARNLKLRIFPGSSLAGKSPRWLVAAEIAETARVYARTVAYVEPGWIERQSKHLLKSNLSSPFWSAKRGEAIAYQTVSLYGLVLADKRRVAIHKEDPVLARDLFIREGLVAGAVTSPPQFLAHNLEEIRHVQELEAKGRRRDLLVSEDEIYAFYASRLPERVCRVADLNKWLRKAGAARVNALFLGRDDLLKLKTTDLSEEDFPGTLHVGSLELSLKYRFAPGEKDDGITVHIPVGVLSEVSVETLEWTVPGLLPNVVEQWLRTLPKQKRKHLVPLTDRVDELCVALLSPDRYRQGRLLAALQTLLAERYRLSVDESDWDRQRLTEHLRIYVRILDEQGNTLVAGRDLAALKEKLAGKVADSSAVSQSFEKTGLTGFPDETVTDHVLRGAAGAQVILYPGFDDRGASVDLLAFSSRLERDEKQRHGLARLALLQLGQVGRYFKKEVEKHPQLGLHYVALGTAQQMREQLLLNIAWYCFFEGREVPTDAPAFKQRLDAHRAELGTICSQSVALFAETFARRFECGRSLDTLTSPAYQPSTDDIRSHMERLVPAQLLDQTPLRFLPLIPRYLAGVERRIGHLPGHVKKDQQLTEELQRFEERLQKVRLSQLYDLERWSELRFLVEELRLQLFAEPVARTRVKIHPLDEAWFGPQWKASVKRVSGVLNEEERRVGIC